MRCPDIAGTGTCESPGEYRVRFRKSEGVGLVHMGKEGGQVVSHATIRKAIGGRILQK